MKILIIGSKGFIGSSCVRIFSSQHEIYGCDVVTDYVSTNYLQVNATNADFKDIFKQHRFNACINCSGAASVPDSFKYPVRDFALNTFNVVKILEAIKELQPDCKFINLSSAAVYGNPKTLPITEDVPLSPLSPYGWHKKQAEELVTEYARFFGLKTCSLRLFSVYGPGLRKQLFWDLHVKIMQASEIELWGTGNESRDFIYIDDVVKAMEFTLEKADFKGECINVADGEETSVNYIAKLFQQNHYKQFSFVFGGQQSPGYPINWCADISKIKAFGFQPKTTLTQGLENYISWVKEN